MRSISNSGAGEVLVTESVVEATGIELRFEPVPDVHLRGFNEPTQLFRVLDGARA